MKPRHQEEQPGCGMKMLVPMLVGQSCLLPAIGLLQIGRGIVHARFAG
jgi:hypothetical protein